MIILIPHWLYTTYFALQFVNCYNDDDDRDALEVSPVRIDKKEDTGSVDQSVFTKELDSSRRASDDSINKGNSKSFNLKELLDATENFNMKSLLGEGGLGKVFKGKLKETGQLLAIKQLDSDGSKGMREFLVEMMTLSLVDHPNLVKLVGYCVEAGQKLLVYEYMSLGPLECHLHGPNRKRLDWNIRMKIAAGAARGLEYLHDKMNPPIIYRDLKFSNLLLGEDYHPKLSGFGFSKVGRTGNNIYVSTRMMGTYAPEYAMTGQLTFKSDIYSFGVLLLEIITGRRAIDKRKSGKEQQLVAWAQPLLKKRENIFHMVDPALQGQFPAKSLYKAFTTALLCVQEQPSKRPHVSEVVKALDHIVSQPYTPQSHPSQKTPEIVVVI